MKILSYNYLDHIKELKGKEEAYTLYLQTEFYQNKLKDILSESGKPIVDSILKSTIETYKSLDRLDGRLAEINNNVIDGFDDVIYALGETNNTLGELFDETTRISGILDWGFNVLIEQQRVSNLLLQDISVALRIPDFEKERIHYIEKGLRQLKKALFDADFYQKAEENFQEALKRDSTDHFTLLRIGLIHLLTPKGANFTISMQYLEASMKSIRPEVLGNPQDIDLKRQYAVTAFYLASVNMIVGEYKKGKTLLHEAIKANPSFFEAKFQLCKAKYKLLDSSYLTDLRQLIDENPLYYTKSKYDPDLASDEKTTLLLQEILNLKRDPIISKINQIKGSMDNESKFNNYIKGIEFHAYKSYIGVLRAEQMLLTTKDAEFYKPINNKEDDLKYGSIKTERVRKTGNIHDLVVAEARYLKLYRQRKTYLSTHILEFQLTEQAQRAKVNEANRRRKKYNVLVQCILLLVLPFLFLSVGREIKYLFKSKVELSFFEKSGFIGFVESYTFFAFTWIFFGAFAGLAIIKSLYKPNLLKFLGPNTGMNISMGFAIINGASIINDNWKKDAAFFDWIGNAFASIIVFLISLGIGMLLANIFRTLLKED